jgi:hypothetical protein
VWAITWRRVVKRPSLAVLSMCDAAKIFFTFKFSYILFCNRTHTTETRPANKWGTTNCKPRRPIIMMGQSVTLSRTRIKFITLFFSAAQQQDWPPLQTNCAIMLSQTIFLAKPEYFNFSSSNFIGQDHIRSTVGDALKSTMGPVWKQYKSSVNLFPLSQDGFLSFWMDGWWKKKMDDAQT